MMAYITNWSCIWCGKNYHSVIPKDHICYDCKKKKEARERIEHFGKLDALTIEERLREVENWIYNHSHDGLMREERW